jgi:hypothetical protein
MDAAQIVAGQRMVGLPIHIGFGRSLVALLAGTGQKRAEQGGSALRRCLSIGALGLFELGLVYSVFTKPIQKSGDWPIPRRQTVEAGSRSPH